GALARAGAAARTGDLGAAIRPLEPAPRQLRVGEAQVPLHASRNPLVRAGQSVYDARLQKALEKNPEGRVAAHAARRVGGSLSETARYQARMREAPASTLQRGGKKLGKVEQAALRLTSENSTAEEAARYHLEQAAKGVGAQRNLKLAQLYQQVTKRGLLTQDEAGNVVVDAAAHPHLALVDARLARGQ